MKKRPPSRPRAKPGLDRRSDCPIACTLDLLGDRWTMLIVRDLFLGRRRFADFLASPEGIATNILAARLERLEREGLVERIAEATHRKRAEYRLSARGTSLRPVMRALLAWGLANVSGTSTAAAGREFA